MGMCGNVSDGDRGVLTKSPWTTHATASPVKDADSDSWPELSEANQPPKIDANMCPESTVKSTPPQNTAQAKIEQLKTNERGTSKYPRKPHGIYHNKTVKQGPSGASPIPIPIPAPTPIFYHPTIPTVFNSMIPMPPISAGGYAHRVSNGYLPRADMQILKPGSDTPAQEFVLQVNGGFHPSPYVDTGANYFIPVRRFPGVKDRVGQMNPSWNNQRPVVYYNATLQQAMGPMPFISPPFSGPSGFVGRPYLAAPPGFVRVPYQPPLVSYPVKPCTPMPPTPTMSLRASIVTQIEYYFSDENLQTDHYLISLMDGEGWVPISVIARFPRIKKMKADIPFILNSLLPSESIEVQGERIRRWNTWSKWVPSTAISKSSPPVSSPVKNDEFNESKTDRFEETEVLHSPKLIKDCQSPNLGRSEDDNDVNDQAIERLVVVTQQNKRTSEGSGEESKAMSSELASAINSLLHFDEQLQGVSPVLP